MIFFKRQREEEAKVHGQNEVYKLPISVQKEGLLYNPVNMKIEDAKRLEEKDIREKNKKKRFEIKYLVEEDLRTRGIEDLEKTKMQKLNRQNYRRYVEYMDRGFDILTNDRFDSPEMQSRIHKPLVPEKPKVWNIIESQRNQTQPQTPGTISQPIREENQQPLSEQREEIKKEDEKEEDEENQQKLAEQQQAVEILPQSQSKRVQLEPIIPKSKHETDVPPIPQSKRMSGSIVDKPSSKRSNAPIEKPQSKNVLSHAGAEHIASRGNPASGRSIRTGAFQGVPIKH